jgi:hypothetical protein
MNVVHTTSVPQDWRSSVAQSVWAQMLAGSANAILPDEEPVPHSSVDNAEPRQAWDPTTATVARLGEARAA